MGDALFFAYQKSSERYNLRKKHVTYAVGDTVWRKNFAQSNSAAYFSAKLAPRFIKTKVVRKVSDVIYVLADEAGKLLGKYHVKDMVKLGTSAENR